MQNSIWASIRTAYNNGVLDYSAIVGGKIFYVDAVHGSDTSGDGSHDKPFATLAYGYAACTAGHNDTVVIVSDGQTTGTQRIDAAFTWAKDSTHLVGLGAPLLFSPRARMAPTSSTTAFADFFTISADNCLFENVSWFHDFATDTNDQVAVTLSGERNAFKNCHIAGIAKGSDAGGRCLKITGGGENVFTDCVIGIDTVDRSAANANIEFTSGTARNVFRNCIVPSRVTAATPLAIKTAASTSADRFQLFDNCLFINHNSTQVQTAVCTLAASTGGWFIFHNCCLVKFTGFGSDATSRGQIMIQGGTPAAATTALAVAPSA